MEPVLPSLNLKDVESDYDSDIASGKFVKDGEETIHVLVKFSFIAGGFISEFQIGDEPCNTGVKLKVAEHFVIPCMEEYSKSGEREFERGSITYEFLYKPLKISSRGVPTILRDPFYNCFPFVKNRLENRGYQFFRK